MFALVHATAKVDFLNKTIEFESDFKLSDIRLIQESLVNWEEYRIVRPPQITWTGGYPYPQGTLIGSTVTKGDSL
jgi:hypothetical protein